MLKASFAFLVGAVLSVALAQKEAEPTSIGPHRVGETLQQWLSASHELDNLDAVCHSRNREDKIRCKFLKDFRDGKENEIGTGDANRAYKWTFVKGRLLEITVSVPGPLAPASIRPNIQEEIGYLIQKYGQPALAKTVPFTNYYGEKFDCQEDHWTMPDGTEIIATERIVVPAAGEPPRRELSVRFVSKESTNNKTQPKQNPYDH